MDTHTHTQKPDRGTDRERQGQRHSNRSHKHSLICAYTETSYTGAAPHERRVPHMTLDVRVSAVEYAHTRRMSTAWRSRHRHESLRKMEGFGPVLVHEIDAQHKLPWARRFVSVNAHA